MDRCIGSLKDSRGDIIFSMDGDTFLISSFNKQVAVSDEELKDINGKMYANIDFLNLMDFHEVEVPEYVLELKTKIRHENALAKNSLVVVEHPKGKIYIAVSNDCKIITKMEDKTVTADKTYLIEGKRALYVPELELETAFIEVPEIVEDRLKGARKAVERQNLHLVYAGKSLLTGKDYYKLSSDVDTQTWYRIRDVFQWFGEDRNTGGLFGWLTATPDLVEQYLYLKTPAVEARKTDIEKQKVQAEKKQGKIIEAILKNQ